MYLSAYRGFGMTGIGGGEVFARGNRVLVVGPHFAWVFEAR